MKKILISMIAFAMMLLPGCEKLKDVTSRDFTVNNIQFDFAATTQNVTTLSGDAAVATRAAATTSFSVTRTVDISEMGNADAIKYADKISKVVVNSSLITVTATSAGTYTVTDLTIKAGGVDGTLVIPTYTMGGTFVAPANMNAYTSAFIMKLLAAKTISVTVSGNSDAPAGTTLNIKYKNDILITAGLL